jgi:thioredoxin-like negative regulator of GroEL
MQLLTGTDFQSFIEAKKAAVVPFDAEWDVAYRPVLRRRMRMLEAEELLADQVNFGEVDCDTNLDLAESIPIPNVPSVVYYRNGELIVALVGAEQNVRARVERVLRGESIGYKDGLGPMQVPAPTPPAKS